MKRRDFLLRGGKACGLAAASAGAALWMAQRPSGHSQELVDALRDFSVPQAPELPGVSIAKGMDPVAMVRKSIDALGGMSRFVEKGDIVVIKPNAAFDRPPPYGATTSPEVVGEVVRLCKAAGAETVRVTDFPIHSFERCFDRSGIGQAVQIAGGEVVAPERSGFLTVDLAGWVVEKHPFHVAPFEGATKLIGIPTAKDHNLCGASLAMKNWYGFLGEGRNRLHQDIHEAITDLGQAFKPTLVVLDATRLLMRNGPTGGSSSDVAPGNTICCSTDQVAVDSFGAEMLGKKDLCRYVQLAEERGLGQSDWRGLGVKEVAI